MIFCLRQRQKIHLTLYESWKVITYQAVATFFKKMIYSNPKKNLMEETTTNIQTKNPQKHGSKNYGTKHI